MRNVLLFLSVFAILAAVAVAVAVASNYRLESAPGSEVGYVLAPGELEVPECPTLDATGHPQYAMAEIVISDNAETASLLPESVARVLKLPCSCGSGQHATVKLYNLDPTRPWLGATSVHADAKSRASLFA